MPRPYGGGGIIIEDSWTEFLHVSAIPKEKLEILLFAT